MATHSRFRSSTGRIACALLLVSSLVMLPGGTSAQGTLSALQTDVDQIARRARPAVVTVLAQRVPRGGDAKGRLQSHVGSGVAVEINTILTTASVVLGADRVIVRTANGLSAQGMVVGADPISNVALVRVPNLRLPVVRLAQRRLDVGDWVVSLGTSYGSQPTQSVGNVAYRHREPAYSLLQLTNTVYPGNSGAAALNPAGELVGIVQGELGTPELIADGSERRPGLASFVLPIESLRPVMDAIRRTGRVRHGFLGVTTRAITVASTQRGGTPTPIGALVEAIVPGSPAERMGLRHGDLIVGYQGERVEYPEQLARWVAGTTPGLRVEVVWAREEVQMSAEAAMGASPSVNPAWLATSWSDDDQAPSAAKISEIQREIRRLNGELNRIKSSGQGTTQKR